MASANNILIGAATIYYAAWTSSQADLTDASMTDIGYTSGPVEWGGSIETYDVNVEQSFFPVKTKLLSQKLTIKVPLVELTLTTLAKLFNQTYTSGALTIAQPDETLWYQIVIKGPTPDGTANTVRRYRFYKCKLLPPSAVQIGKGQESRADLSIVPVYDTTRTTPSLASWADAAT